MTTTNPSSPFIIPILQMNLLNKFKSKDPQKIWSASCDVAKCNNLDTLSALSEHLEVIKESTKGIELGGGLCPNSYHLEFAIRKLTHVKNNAGCLCKLYPDNMFYSPKNEANADNITINDTVIIDDNWVDYYLCHCNKCQSEFKVEEREGHFTWWSWKNIIK